MKKHIFVLLLLTATFIAAAGENLTLVPVKNGPEHGTLHKYILVGSDQVNKLITKEEIKYNSISDTIIVSETKTTSRRYLGEVFFTGNNFNEEAVIAAIREGKKTITREEIKEEAGYTHWGFIKNYRIKTPTTTYALISKSPLTVADNEKIYYAGQSRFHFGSVAALFVILLFGVDLGIFISRGPKEWLHPKKWLQRKLNDSFGASELIFFALQIYAIGWSFGVGTPFLFLAIGALLPGIIVGSWKIIFPKKEKPKTPIEIEIHGLQ